jgi:glycosyltransferase involved in cell wall biosynthesis
MQHLPAPSISAVIAAYNAEPFIGPALDSIVGQTRPPDEIVVVDDGSTDGTAGELRRYGGRIRVITQANAGYQEAMNRAIAEATGEFVALCGADDLWEPDKLRWQEEAIRAHPEVDVFFGHFEPFGDFAPLHGRRPDTRRPPAEGVLDTDVLRDALLQANIICTPFVTMRRSLFDRLGFFEAFKGDDYDYWFRCLGAGVRFHYDPRLIGHHRRHGANLTNDLIGLYEAMNLVRYRYADQCTDRRVWHRSLAVDHFRIGRLLVDDGRPAEARASFRLAVRHSHGLGSIGARSLGWLGVLGLPAAGRRRGGEALVRLSRGLDALRGGRSAAAP